MYIATLDISGTKTVVAILDENGGTLVQKSFPPIVARYETHLELCIQTMKCLMHQTELQAGDFTRLGMSLPEVMGNEKGILFYASYANWKNMETAGYLSRNLGTLRMRCEDDINAYAVGEERFGLGNNYTDFIWMTVSTGVGGAMIEGSKLVRGDPGFTGELGHLKIECRSPAHCPCSQYGCLGAHGSRTALIRETRKRRFTSPTFAKALDEMGLKPDGAGYAALARAGNTDTLDILNQIGTYLGRGISYYIDVLDTRAVVIGGGIAASLDLLLPSIHVSAQRNAFKQMQDIDIVKTPLGYEVALLGAAALVLEQ